MKGHDLVEPGPVAVGGCRPRAMVRPHRPGEGALDGLIRAFGGGVGVRAAQRVVLGALPDPPEGRHPRCRGRSGAGPDPAAAPAAGPVHDPGTPLRLRWSLPPQAGLRARRRKPERPDGQLAARPGGDARGRGTQVACIIPLNSYLDLASDQGVLPRLLATAALARRYTHSYLLPAPNHLPRRQLTGSGHLRHLRRPDSHTRGQDKNRRPPPLSSTAT